LQNDTRRKDEASGLYTLLAPSPDEGRTADGPGSVPPGTLIDGRYQIDKLIWRSPFGEVYRAIDQSSRTPVAVRALDPDLCGDPASQKRVAQIITALAQLEHKNLARPLGVAVQNGITFVINELVDGQTLRQLLEKRRAQGGGPFSLKAAYNVVQHVIAGLAAAHQVTWHGALSASNVLVDRSGRVKLTELGLGRALPGFVRTPA
jgi:serine/threonine protein kinase